LKNFGPAPPEFNFFPKRNLIFILTKPAVVYRSFVYDAMFYRAANCEMSDFLAVYLIQSAAAVKSFLSFLLKLTPVII